MDVGLLLVRVVVGLLLAGHGAQKLFGWFGGYGIEGTGGFLESLGWRPGRRFAVLAGILELVGGLGLAFGLGTPLAAGVVGAVLANAAWFAHRRNGLWNSADGFEYPLVLITVALTLGWTGAGRLSIDQLLGWPLGGLRSGLWALGVALAGWLAGGVTRRRQTPARTDATVGQAA